MEKTKGIVMRTSAKATVIFTEKGDYLEIPTPKDPPLVGQTIEVNLNPRRLFMFHNSTLRYISVAAVLLLVLSISTFYLIFNPNMAVASVALNINNNKGIELSVNKEGKVIKVPDVNSGLSILTGINLQGLDVYQTVGLILDNANHNGMLNEKQNLIMASVVSTNDQATQLINTEKLRNTIRDEMTHKNLSGNVVVSQVNQKIQQEATQLGMTVNGYLIYSRCETKGIAVQLNTLRNDLQKALTDTHVTVASLFPEESFEVGSLTQTGNDNSTGTKKESNFQNGSQDKPSSTMGSAENQGYMGPSAKQTPSSSSTFSNGMNSNTPSDSPAKQPMQGTSPNLNMPSSNPVSPGNMPNSASPQQSANPSYNGMNSNTSSNSSVKQPMQGTSSDSPSSNPVSSGSMSNSSPPQQPTNPSNNGMNSDTPSDSSAKQSIQRTSPNLNKPSSGPISSGMRNP